MKNTGATTTPHLTEDGRTEYYVAGEVTFDKGQLNSPLQPDDFRQSLFLPLAADYIREDISVSESDDTTFRYSFWDRQLPLKDKD